MTSCCAFGCTNRHAKAPAGTSFHSFPKDAQRRALWIKEIKRKDWNPSEHTKICSAHFTPDMLDKSMRRIQLRPHAIPTVFDAFPSYLQKKTVYKCKLCYKEFRFSTKLEKHMRSHAIPLSVPVWEFKCASCDLSFNSATLLKEHITRLHIKLELLDCNQCGDSFADEASYENHMATHMSVKVFKCSKCEKSFGLLRNLKCHERAHFKKNKMPKVCNICEKSFSTTVALKKHKLVHLTIKPDLNDTIAIFNSLEEKEYMYPCSLCKKRFLTCRELRKHEAAHAIRNADFHSNFPKIVKISGSGIESNSEPEKTKCASFDSSFNSATLLKDHINEPHIKMDCSMCGNIFSDEVSYKNHLDAHMSVNIFKCGICSKSFKLFRNLKCHERAHFIDKKGQRMCKICKKSFPTSVSLKEHKLTHLNTKLGVNYKVNNIESPRKKNIDQCITSENKIVKAKDSEVQSNWCHLCNFDLASSEEFRLHVLQEHRSMSDFDKTHVSSLKDYKSLNKKIQHEQMERNIVKSSRGRKRTSKNEKDQPIDAIKKQPGVGSKVPNTKSNLTDAETCKQILQNPVNNINGSLFVVEHNQPQQSRIIFNVAQPVQNEQFSSNEINASMASNMSLITGPPVSAPQTDSNTVPKFDFDSEEYFTWLKALINKCKSQEYPLPLNLAKNISQVSSDLLNALITPVGSLRRKENHFYTLKFYQIITKIMLGQAKYYLAPEQLPTMDT